jgi:hypothetical protein
MTQGVRLPPVMTVRCYIQQVFVMAARIRAIGPASRPDFIVGVSRAKVILVFLLPRKRTRLRLVEINLLEVWLFSQNTNWRATYFVELTILHHTQRNLGLDKMRRRTT